MTLKAGQTLSHYRLIQKIGEGGMGMVWKAVDTRLDRPVALKMLSEAHADDRERLARFEREAKTLAALNHPGIVTIFSTELLDLVPLLVMEFVEGPTLADAIPEHGFALDQFLELAVPLTDAVGAAHEHGITHRDLKAANVVLDQKRRPKVLDFGLAKLREPSSVPSSDETRSASLTQNGSILGTPFYMSPEQLKGGPVDHQSDIFSLGVLFYEMATGQRPFGGRTMTEVISAILTEEPPPVHKVRPTLPNSLSRIVERSLAKKRERRYPNAQELLHDLNYLAESPTLEDRAKGRPDAPPWDHSIAVLPIQNLSGDPTQQYIADGMTEALITDLARIRSLKVISRTSVMQYKGAKKPLSTIAQELGVDTIVEGSVLCAGDRVRITAQLIDAATDQHLWADRYDRDLRDVLAIQSQVAQAVVKEVDIKLTADERVRISESRQVDPEVYLRDLKGRHFLNLRTEDGFRRGLDCFQRAIDIDPAYSPAYVGLADCFNMLMNYGIVPVQEGLPRSTAALARALELDDRSGAAHRALAQIHWHCKFDWAEAERTYARAIELDPSSAVTWYWYGAFLGVQGQFDESLARLRRSQELDPLSLLVTCFIGWLHYTARRFEEAIVYCQEVLQIDRESLMANWYMGLASTELGRYDEGVDWLEKSMTIAGRTSRLLAYQGYVYGRAGRENDARGLLKELHSRSKQGFVPPYFFTLIHCGLGDRERAFESLRRAAELPDAMVRDVKVDPPIDILRSDSRYGELLRHLRIQ